jgi:hypothetical protein
MVSSYDCSKPQHQRILAFDFSLTHHYNLLNLYLSSITEEQYHEGKKDYRQEENG